MTARTCCDCSGPISRLSKGRCKPCSARRLNNDPAISARREKAQREYFARPEVKRELAERIARAVANLTPEQIEARRRQGVITARDVLRRPDVAARSNSPASKRLAGQGRTNTTLAWCPPEYRQRYRDLKDRKQLRASEARTIIEAEVAADQRKRDAALTPFERQMAKVAAGAKLIEKPVFRQADPTMTLGGVATGLL